MFEVNNRYRDKEILRDEANMRDRIKTTKLTIFRGDSDTKYWKVKYTFYTTSGAWGKYSSPYTYSEIEIQSSDGWTYKLKRSKSNRYGGIMPTLAKCKKAFKHYWRHFEGKESNFSHYLNNFDRGKNSPYSWMSSRYSTKDVRGWLDVYWYGSDTSYNPKLTEVAKEGFDHE